MDLNRAHALENFAFVLVRVMTEDKAIANGKCVLLSLALVFDKLPGRGHQIVFGKLRILRQQMIHVSRDSAHRDTLHVYGDHLD